MNNRLKEQIRQILIERFDVDINNAVCHFSTQNYAFIFPGEQFMIRVSATSQKTRSEIMSELVWLDDLRQFKKTICEPTISKSGNLLEEFEINGQTYRASMFRTARGEIRSTDNMGPMYFICVGDLLGTIHYISTDERRLGISFKRKSLAEDFSALKKRISSQMPLYIFDRITKAETAVSKLPQDIGEYGLCHGDFHMNNFFVEENNVWVFDFDSCTYTHYLYDIASFIIACFLQGYGAGKDLREVMNKEILTYFKIGYEINHKCGEHFWNNLDLFITYRCALSYMALLEIGTVGLLDDDATKRVKYFFEYALSKENTLDAITDMMMSSDKLL